jgi:hypothetical protein
MRRRAVRLLLVVALLGTASPASAADGLDWGLGLDGVGATSTFQEATQSTPYGICTVTAQVWLRELGLSGVTRLRGRFELRSVYDPGFLPTYQKTPWNWTIELFADDSVSHWGYFNARLNIPVGGVYALWFVGIGERPSFWQPDLKLHGRIGEVGCPTGGFFS